MYKRVYSPDGTPFDVPTNRANELILQKGWTQTEPTFASDEPAAPKKTSSRRRKKVEEPVETPVEEVESEVEAYDVPETPVEAASDDSE